jgi:hypothetical protein
LVGTAPKTQLGVFNADVGNAERAFLERYYYCDVGGGNFQPALHVPAMTYISCSNLLSFARAVVRLVKPALRSYMEVINMYVGPKRARYLLAYVTIMSRGFNTSYARLKAFIKFEKCALTKAPRVINPRSPEYNLELARYLKALEKPIFKAIDQVCGGPTIIKGYDHFESARHLRSMWVTFADPVAIGLDAKKFDMHVSVEALRYEHSIYNAIYLACDPYMAYISAANVGGLGHSGTCERLMWLLNQQLFNRGKARFADGRLNFAMSGTRSSGDLNTSLGNCIIMCSLVHSLLDFLGIVYRLANNGDDCVLIVERSDLAVVGPQIVPWFLKYGFRLTVEPPVCVFERIEFCQTQPLFDGSRWRAVRHPLVVVQKAAMCLIPLRTARDLRRWLMAVGMCEGFMYDGVPILGHWARMYRRHGVYASLGFQRLVYRGTSRQYLAGGYTHFTQPTPCARVSFYRAFGITPDQQVAIEKCYDRLIMDLSQPWQHIGDAVSKPMFTYNSVFGMVAGK